MPLLLCLVVGAVLPKSWPVRDLMPWSGALFLFASGLEFSLRGLRSEARQIAWLWVGGFFAPLAAGIALVYAQPGLFIAPWDAALKTALVVGAALAVSAVPVIIKILQEAGLATAPVGRKIVLAAILCDLAAWAVFVPLLPTQGAASWLASHGPLIFLALGVAIGSMPSLRGRAPLKFAQLASVWVAAPLFFIGAGQSLDFRAGFHFAQATAVLLVAIAAKGGGAWLGARAAGFPSRECRVIAAALNARGAMEILLAGLALRSGLIDQRLFATLIFVAVMTSVLAKPFVAAHAARK